MADGQYTARPEAMRSAVGNVGGILMQAMTVVMDVEQMICPPTSFAGIGTGVAAQNVAMHAHQLSSLQSLLKLLKDVNDLVARCAQDYQAADQQAATAFGGQPATSTSSLWTSSAAGQLGTTAMGSGTAQPHSVSTVTDALSSSGIGSTPAFAHGSQLGDWLDADPSHQSQSGLVGVYDGAARTLGDVPGGVQPGDVVIAGSGSPSIVGIVGSNGLLYNNGPLTTDLSGGVRVYRPLSA